MKYNLFDLAHDNQEKSNEFTPADDRLYSAITAFVSVSVANELLHVNTVAEQ